MTRFALALSVCLGLVSVNFADDSTKAKSASPGTESEKRLADQLQEKPDDIPLFNKYMIKHLGVVRGLINADPDQAEKHLAEIKSLIESLEPQTSAGKQIVGRAKSAISSYGQQVELGRVTLEELAAKLSENPDDAESISLYQQKLSAAISPITRSQPDQAESLLNAGKKFLATIKEGAQQDSSKRTIERIERSFGRLEQSIEAAKKLAALVGSEAAPLEAEAWVNGDPLSDADLKGKVVLLDFWAVWCGPCIRTFPQLREYHETYAD